MNRFTKLSLFFVLMFFSINLIEVNAETFKSPYKNFREYGSFFNSEKPAPNSPDIVDMTTENEGEIKNNDIHSNLNTLNSLTFKDLYKSNVAFGFNDLELKASTKKIDEKYYTLQVKEEWNSYYYTLNPNEFQLIEIDKNSNKKVLAEFKTDEMNLVQLGFTDNYISILTETINEVQLENGDYYYSGYTNIKDYDYNMNEISNINIKNFNGDYNIESIVKHEDFHIISVTIYAEDGSYESRLLKVDNEGNILWNKLVNTSDYYSYYGYDYLDIVDDKILLVSVKEYEGNATFTTYTFDGDIVNSCYFEGYDFKRYKVYGDEIIVASDNLYLLDKNLEIKTTFDLEDSLEQKFYDFEKLSNGNYVFFGGSYEFNSYSGYPYYMVMSNDLEDVLFENGMPSISGVFAYGYVFEDNDTYYLVAYNKYSHAEQGLYLGALVSLSQASANLDLNILPSNTLEISLSTNTMNFEEYNGTKDFDKEMEVYITSSLNYNIYSYLKEDFKNSENKIIDRSNFNIKESNSEEYKSFANLNDNALLVENAESGKDKTHTINIRLIGDSSVKEGNYIGVFGFDAIQR